MKTLTIKIPDAELLEKLEMFRKVYRCTLEEAVIIALRNQLNNS